MFSQRLHYSFIFFFLIFFVANRSILPEVFCKKGVLKNFTKFTGKNLYQRPFLKKLQAPATLLKKESLAQVFSCEFCETFKNTFFYRTPLAAASVEP